MARRPWAPADRGARSAYHPRCVQQPRARYWSTPGGVVRDRRTCPGPDHGAAPAGAGHFDDRVFRSGGDGIAASVRRTDQPDQSISRRAVGASSPLRANSDSPKPAPPQATTPRPGGPACRIPGGRQSARGTIKRCPDFLGPRGPDRIRFTTRKTNPYKMLRSPCLHVAKTY